MPSIEAIYDELADSYGSEEHETTRFFYLTQELFLHEALLTSASKLKKDIKTLRVLNVGPGPDGNSTQMSGTLCLGNVAYFDISENVLEAVANSYADALSRC